MICVVELHAISTDKYASKIVVEDVDNRVQDLNVTSSATLPLVSHVQLHHFFNNDYLGFWVKCRCTIWLYLHLS